jgi:DNA polymerase-1
MPNQRPLLALLDGHALAFRAFHALAKAGLRASTGEATYAVFGFISILLNAIHEHHPKYVAVSFDVGRTFRDDLYADYKAGRGEAPDEFNSQLDRIQQLIQAFNIPIYTFEGYEADDVIGTLASQATAQGVDTMILTGDTDTLQLVDDHVNVLLANPYVQKGKNTVLYDEAQVLERYNGLTPSQLADLRGLKGDTSDNIPGVKGIGEAGAIALLKQFGTVENLYDHLDEAPNRFKKALEGQREAAVFSKQLATIVCDVPVTLDLRACELRDYDRSKVIALFQELEIGSSLIKRLPATGGGMEVEDLPTTTDAGRRTTDDGGEPLSSSVVGPSSSGDGPQQLAMFDMPAAPAARPGALVSLPNAEKRAAFGDYRAVQTVDQLSEVVAALQSAPGFAFDTETTGTRAVQDDLVGISISIQPGQAWYIPVGHRADEQLPRATVLDALRPFFADAQLPKYGHNAKFDIEVLEHAGLNVVGVTFDTMLAAALLDKRKGLKELAFYELKLPEPMTDIDELIGKRGKNQLSFADVPVDQATPYAAADADMTIRLVEALAPQLAEQHKVYEIFQKLEMPLLPVLVRMEQAGIGLDAPFLRELGRRMGDDLAKLEDQIYAFNDGLKFNINSGDQLSDVLFKKLNMPTAGLERTKTGRYSLTAGVLERLQAQGEYPIIDLILRYRQLTKLKSTYVDALPDMVNPETGRVHTTYSQIGSATGRLSCLPAGTLLNTQRGLVGIETVHPGEMIRTAHGPRRVLAWQATGEKPVVVLRLSNGITLRCSPEHRIRSRGAWIEAKDIMVGDPVYMSFTPGLFGDQTALNLHYASHHDTQKTPTLPTEWTVELAELVGYHMADAHIARSNYNGKPAKVILAFGWEDGELIDHFTAIIRDIFGKEPTRRITKACPVLEVSGVDIGGALEQLGAGGKSKEIRVPPSLFQAPEPIVAAFLRGYFEGDGYAGPDAGIMVRSVSRAMLEDIQQLLTMFGVPSSFKSGSIDPKGYAPRHQLSVVGDRSKQVFFDRIGFLSRKKQQACVTVISSSKVKSTAESLKLPVEFDINTLKSAIYTAHRRQDGRVPVAVHSFTSKLVRGQQTMTLARAEWVVKSLPDSLANQSAIFLHEAVNAQYYEVKVVNIAQGSPVPMYDIAVEQVAQYMAQGIVVHNSNEPNLQNIPTRTEEGREIRRGFVAAPGCVFIAADYSQIELRVLAHITQDKNLMQAFLEGQDIHAATASQLFGVPIDKVDRNQRRIAKTSVFGIIYGISAFGLAPRIGTSRTEAQQLIDELFARFPKLRDYIDSTLEEGRREGFVRSLFGRRRYMPDLRVNGPRRQAAEREAINAPIQATAADIMKIAMIRVDEELRRHGLKTRMLLQVHDELIFEAPRDEVEQVVQLVCDQMQGAHEMRVPLKVDVESGPNWEEMKEVETPA